MQVGADLPPRPPFLIRQGFEAGAAAGELARPADRAPERLRIVRVTQREEQLGGLGLLILAALDRDPRPAGLLGERLGDLLAAVMRELRLESLERGVAAGDQPVQGVGTVDGP